MPIDRAQTVDLMNAMRPLMKAGFSMQQAFEISLSRAGLVGQTSWRAFSSTVGRMAASNAPGMGRGPALAQWMQSFAPAVGGGVSLLRYYAQLGAARVMGRLSPRAGAMVIKSGALTGPGFLAAAAVLLAVGGGAYMAANWGRAEAAPVQPGVRMMEAYVPIVVEKANGGGIYSVRTLGAVKKGMTRNQFRHGGIKPTPARIRVLAKGTTRAGATAHLAQMVQRGSLRRPPLAAGFVAKVGGQTVTIDDWGNVDFQVLREMTR